MFIKIFDELLKTERRNVYLPVINDKFIKMPKTVPMKGIKTQDVAGHFMNEYVF